MSAVQIPNRPVFNSLEPGLDTDLTPPVSGLAIVATILGIASLSAALSVNAVPFAIVVAVLCAVLTWRLSGDPTVSGLRLAQAGLCCSVVGATWGLTAKNVTEAYYYSQAAEHAKVFLQTLSVGKKFDAFELMQPEPSRQVTGTDIEAHYNGLISASLPVRTEMSMPEDMPSGETMKNSHAKEELEEFLSTASTKEIMSHGQGAKWEFVRGAGVARMSNNVNRISVVMVDKSNPAKKYSVELNRVVGGVARDSGMPPVAIWDIDRTKLVKE